VKTIAQLHSIFFIFPLVCFGGALVADILHYFGKLKSLTWGFWFVIVGVIFCVPTIVTGLANGENYDINNPIFTKHRFFAYATAIFASSYTGLRISFKLWKIPLKPVHFIILSAFLFALTWLTVDYGLLINSLSKG